MLILFLAILLAYSLTRLLLYPIMDMLSQGGATRKNYLNKQIPIGMGIVIWLGLMSACFFYYLFTDTSLINIYAFFFLITVTLFAGFIDDLLGNHSIKGLRGHFKVLLKDFKLTTGAFKAITITLACLVFTLSISKNILFLILNVLILILTTNSFNLLDLRPGRAIKFFIITSVLLLMLFPFKYHSFLLFSLASIIAYLPLDFKGKIMLGDAGANLLGILIGISIIINFSLIVKIIILMFLVFLHIYAEKRSLSSLIEQISWLRFIDELGR